MVILFFFFSCFFFFFADEARSVLFRLVAALLISPIPFWSVEYPDRVWDFRFCEIYLSSSFFFSRFHTQSPLTASCLSTTPSLVLFRQIA